MEYKGKFFIVSNAVHHVNTGKDPTWRSCAPHINHLRKTALKTGTKCRVSHRDEVLLSLDKAHWVWNMTGTASRGYPRLSLPIQETWTVPCPLELPFRITLLYLHFESAFEKDSSQNKLGGELWKAEEKGTLQAEDLA